MMGHALGAAGAIEAVISHPRPASTVPAAQHQLRDSAIPRGNFDIVANESRAARLTA